MEILSSCPICDHNSFHEFLKSRDYFLSKEEFTIVICENCGMKFTNPRPDAIGAMKYYESNEYISHNAHKQNLLNIVYRQVRTFSIQRKFHLVKKYSNGKTLLDIGCGIGGGPPTPDPLGGATRARICGASSPANFHCVPWQALLLQKLLLSLPPGLFVVWHCTHVVSNW